MIQPIQSRRLYEEMAYGSFPIANSYWRTTIALPTHSPLDAPTYCDSVIIGAGYTGLNTALALAKAGQNVVVLDAQQPGWGASGRNGGFCCLGGASLSLRRMLGRFGLNAAQEFLQTTRHAVDHVASLLETYSISADRHSHGETLMAHSAASKKEMQNEIEDLRKLLGVQATFLPKEELAEHGLCSKEFHGALTVPIGFAINPMKYVIGLAQAVLQSGVRIYGESPVTNITQDYQGRHELTTPNGTVSAQNLIIATNGYSSETVPAWLAGRVLPVQSSILVTRQLSPQELADQGWTSRQMCYDSRKLLHYFRLLPDNRMLFGLRGSCRSTQAAHNATKTRARQDFDRMFPAWTHVETSHYWSGLVAIARNLTPFAGPVPGMNQTWGAMCYHGNGVAMGSYAGALLASQILGHGPKTPTLMTQPLRRFELGRWRRLILPLIFGWYEIRDRVW